MKSKSSHPLIVGTVILTLTGLVSRIIGFFYRIYLSRLFGEEGMGLYQLLSPVLSLSFSLTAAGYQTAISKLVAEQTARQKKTSLRPMLAGLSISLPLSLLCNALIYFGADFIASVLLQESRTAAMLRILSFSVPMRAVPAKPWRRPQALHQCSSAGPDHRRIMLHAVFPGCHMAKPPEH